MNDFDIYSSIYTRQFSQLYQGCGFYYSPLWYYLWYIFQFSELLWFSVVLIAGILSSILLWKMWQLKALYLYFCILCGIITINTINIEIIILGYANNVIEIEH